MRRILFPCLLAALGVGCGPVYEGPQLREVPEGLAYSNAWTSARVPLPLRKRVRQIHYVPPPAVERNRSTVVITEYEGLATRTEVSDARDALAAQYTSTVYGPLEDLRIDGKPAWGWTETQREGKTKEIYTMGLTAVVAYPKQNATYSVEFTAGDPAHQRRDILERTVTSFTVASAGPPLGVKLILFGLALFAVTLGAWHLHRTGTLPLGRR